eukprot:g26167.t1
MPLAHACCLHNAPGLLPHVLLRSSSRCSAVRCCRFCCLRYSGARGPTALDFLLVPVLRGEKKNKEKRKERTKEEKEQAEQRSSDRSVLEVGIIQT